MDTRSLFASVAAASAVVLLARQGDPWSLVVAVTLGAALILRGGGSSSSNEYQPSSTSSKLATQDVADADEASHLSIDETPAATAARVEAQVLKLKDVPQEAKLSPAATLRRRWQIPSDVAKELGDWVDLVVRDFVMPWYSVGPGGTGISSDPAFLEYLQYLMVNAIGNLAFRASHVNPLLFACDDATEALRAHLAVFSAMQERAAAKSPELFAPYTDEQLLARARRRLNLPVPPGSASALSSGQASSSASSAAGSSSSFGSSSSSVGGLTAMSTGVREAFTAVASAAASVSGATIGSARDTVPSGGGSGGSTGGAAGSASLAGCGWCEPLNSAAAALQVLSDPGTGSGPVFSGEEREHIAKESRWLQEQQQRAIVAEYAATPGSLHAACEPRSTGVLEADPSPASWENTHTIYGPRAPPSLLAEFDYLRGVSSAVLPRLLPPDEGGSVALGLILREVLAVKLLQPALANGEPDTLNWLLLQWVGPNAASAGGAEAPPADDVPPPSTATASATANSSEKPGSQPSAPSPSLSGASMGTGKGSGPAGGAPTSGARAFTSWVSSVFAPGQGPTAPGSPAVTAAATPASSLPNDPPAGSSGSGGSASSASSSSVSSSASPTLGAGVGMSARGADSSGGRHRGSSISDAISALIVGGSSSSSSGASGSDAGNSSKQAGTAAGGKPGKVPLLPSISGLLGSDSGLFPAPSPRSGQVEASDRHSPRQDDPLAQGVGPGVPRPPSRSGPVLGGEGINKLAASFGKSVMTLVESTSRRGSSATAEDAALPQLPAQAASGSSSSSSSSSSSWTAKGVFSSLTSGSKGATASSAGAALGSPSASTGSGSWGSAAKQGGSPDAASLASPSASSTSRPRSSSSAFFSSLSPLIARAAMLQTQLPAGQAAAGGSAQASSSGASDADVTAQLSIIDEVLADGSPGEDDGLGLPSDGDDDEEETATVGADGADEDVVDASDVTDGDGEGDGLLDSIDLDSDSGSEDDDDELDGNSDVESVSESDEEEETTGRVPLSPAFPAQPADAVAASQRPLPSFDGLPGTFSSFGTEGEVVKPPPASTSSASKAAAVMAAAPAPPASRDGGTAVAAPARRGLFSGASFTSLFERPATPTQRQPAAPAGAPVALKLPQSHPGTTAPQALQAPASSVAASAAATAHSRLIAHQTRKWRRERRVNAANASFRRSQQEQGLADDDDASEGGGSAHTRAALVDAEVAPLAGGAGAATRDDLEAVVAKLQPGGASAATSTVTAGGTGASSSLSASRGAAPTLEDVIQACRPHAFPVIERSHAAAGGAAGDSRGGGGTGVAGFSAAFNSLSSSIPALLPGVKFLKRQSSQTGMTVSSAELPRPASGNDALASPPFAATIQRAVVRVQRSDRSAQGPSPGLDADVSGSGGGGRGSPEKGTVYYVVRVSCGELAWSVKARFSELHAFNASVLKDAAPEVAARFPPKTPFRLLASASQDKAFVAKRRGALDAWLQAALGASHVRDSRELREFLLPPLNAPITRGGTPSRRHARGAGGIPAAGFAAAAAASVSQRPRTAAPPAGKASTPGSSGGSQHPSPALVPGAADRRKVTFASGAPGREASSESLGFFKPGSGDGSVPAAASSSAAGHAPTPPQGATGGHKETGSGKAAGPPVAGAGSSAPSTPTPDGPSRFLSPAELARAESRAFFLLAEVFSLQSRGWIRRQVVGFVRSLVRLLYHGAAAKRVSRAYAQAVSPSSVVTWLHWTRTTVMWPGGALRPYAGYRPWGEQWADRAALRLALLGGIPQALSSLLGREASESGVGKLHAFLQVPVVVRSLTYTLFDLLLARMFPGIPVHGLPRLATAASSAVDSTLPLPLGAELPVPPPTHAATPPGAAAAPPEAAGAPDGGSSSVTVAAELQATAAATAVTGASGGGPARHSHGHSHGAPSSARAPAPSGASSLGSLFKTTANAVPSYAAIERR